MLSQRNPWQPSRRREAAKNESAEGKTPVIADHRARAPLAATAPSWPPCSITVCIALSFALHLVDMQERRGVRSLRVHGKGQKIRYVPLQSAATSAITLYLEAAGLCADKAAPRFQPVSNNNRGLGWAITPSGVYQMLPKYAAGASIKIGGFGLHALRATAATNALKHHADIAKVQDWLGHANIATTRLYDRRHLRAKDSPTFNVAY